MVSTLLGRFLHAFVSCVHVTPQRKKKKTYVHARPEKTNTSRVRERERERERDIKQSAGDMNKTQRGIGSTIFFAPMVYFSFHPITWKISALRISGEDGDDVCWDEVPCASFEGVEHPAVA